VGRVRPDPGAFKLGILAEDDGSVETMERKEFLPLVAGLKDDTLEDDRAMAAPMAAVENFIVVLELLPSVGFYGC